jgi:hypothetical protein
MGILFSKGKKPPIVVSEPIMPFEVTKKSVPDHIHPTNP